MNDLNMIFANQLLFKDPETEEELRPMYEIRREDGKNVLYVTNKDGTRKWKHIIKTIEI